MGEILVIDDDVEELEIFTEALDSIEESLHCLCFSNHVEAIQHLNAGPNIHLKCIFIDVHLPTSSGQECLDTIRKIPGMLKIPVVIFSSDILETQRQSFIERGASFVLKKPSTIANYREMIRGVISAKAL